MIQITNTNRPDIVVQLQETLNSPKSYSKAYFKHERAWYCISDKKMAVPLSVYEGASNTNINNDLLHSDAIIAFVDGTAEPTCRQKLTSNYTLHGGVEITGKAYHSSMQANKIKWIEIQSKVLNTFAWVYYVPFDIKMELLIAGNKKIGVNTYNKIQYAGSFIIVPDNNGTPAFDSNNISVVTNIRFSNKFNIRKWKMGTGRDDWKNCVETLNITQKPVWNPNAQFMLTVDQKLPMYMYKELKLDNTCKMLKDTRVPFLPTLQTFCSIPQDYPQLWEILTKYYKYAEALVKNQSLNSFVIISNGKLRNGYKILIKNISKEPIKVYIGRDNSENADIVTVEHVDTYLYKARLDTLEPSKMMDCIWDKIGITVERFNNILLVTKPYADFFDTNDSVKQYKPEIRYSYYKNENSESGEIEYIPRLTITLRNILASGINKVSIPVVLTIQKSWIKFRKKLYGNGDDNGGTLYCSVDINEFYCPELDRIELVKCTKVDGDKYGHELMTRILKAIYSEKFIASGLAGSTHFLGMNVQRVYREGEHTISKNSFASICGSLGAINANDDTIYNYYSDETAVRDLSSFMNYIDPLLIKTIIAEVKRIGEETNKPVKNSNPMPKSILQINKNGDTITAIDRVGLGIKLYCFTLRHKEFILMFEPKGYKEDNKISMSLYINTVKATDSRSFPTTLDYRQRKECVLKFIEEIRQLVNNRYGGNTSEKDH